MIEYLCAVYESPKIYLGINNLIKCVGVVETGLFLGMADTIVVGNADKTCKLIGLTKFND